MRGTWQGSGTWQTSGPDLGGLVVPVVVIAAVVAVAEFILSVIVWLAIAAGVVLVIAAAGLVWWLHGAPKRRAEHAAIYAAAFEAHRRPATVTATVVPQVQPVPPAIERHVHFHFDPADREAIQVIRSILPGQAGGSTGRES